MGESYIVRGDGSWVNPSTGRESQESVPGSGLTEYVKYKMNRRKVGSALWQQPMPDDQLRCSNCHAKQITHTKQQLLQSLGHNVELKKKVEEECKDGITYMFCTRCGEWCKELEFSQEPNLSVIKSTICWKCLDTTHGTSINMQLKLMHENPADENRKCGEAPISQQKWYWSCSSCGFRYEMPKNLLSKQYSQKSSSIQTMILSKPSKRKPGSMSEKEQEDVKAGFGGYPTSKISETEYPPPV